MRRRPRDSPSRRVRAETNSVRFLRPGRGLPRAAALCRANAGVRASDGGDDHARRDRDRTELAERFGFSRARITQLLDLLLPAPDLQEAILFGETTRGRD